MTMDMANMLFVSNAMDRMKIHLPFDHTSILREYRNQVPLEFDFERERDMLTRIGGAVTRAVPDVRCPAAFEAMSSKRVLTMSFVEGESLADVIQRALNANGLSTRAGHSEAAAAAMKTSPSGAAVDASRVLTKLVETFGVQIFEIGTFHSDPHPGNLLLSPDGKTLSLIDFGQCKVLSDETRITLAKLTLALACGARDDALAHAETLGLRLTNASPDFALTVLYILFDTRMDIEEAHVSPLDADLPAEMRAVNIRTIPEEVFMMIRVVALIRGMLISCDVDVHARDIWKPYAIQALQRAGETVPEWAWEKKGKGGGGSKSGDVRGGGGEEVGTSMGGTYARMKALAVWMKSNDLPCDRKALMPLATVGLMGVIEIANASRRDDATALENGFRKFTPEQRETCVNLALQDAVVLEKKNKKLREEAAKAAENKDTKRKKGAAAGDAAGGGGGGGEIAAAAAEETAAYKASKANGAPSDIAAVANAKKKASFWQRMTKKKK